jgi:hypothetical protein
MDTVRDHGFVLDALESLRAFCLEEHARRRRDVEGLDQAAPAEPQALGDRPRPRWLIIAHVVNHGTQRRSELARYLTDCGQFTR